ncbi:arginine kinase-like [Mytilus edulis]|uniref:arginine kinase-like n=1 Tax=Mytilus edulis TaxID=6550 RepID=UPI0039F08B10
MECNDLEDLWRGISTHTSNSLLKKHLSEEKYINLKKCSTKYGTTLADVIRSGCKNLDSKVGVYACDPESYKVFKDLLEPIICDYHRVKEVNHPKCDYGDVAKLNFRKLDEAENYIISTRVRIGRCHKGFSFPPILTNVQRKEMEEIIVKALNTLEGDLKGAYHSLESMSRNEYQQLVDDHIMFRDDNHTLRDAGGYDGWPVGRGVYLNNKKTFIVWVNEGDHLRFISMEKGSDLSSVYKRLIFALQQVEMKVEFAYDDKRGFLSNCPSNLGTCLRASVHLKMPELERCQEILNDICDRHNLQLRGVNGEHTESAEAVYDVSNKRRLGLTEYQAVCEMYNGVEELIQTEQQLEEK